MRHKNLVFWRVIGKFCGLSYASSLVMVLIIPANVFAAFGEFMPLIYSGSLSYNYGYTESNDVETETTNWLAGLSATGFIWQPWFATTSFGLNLSLSETRTSFDDSDITGVSGSYTLAVFPYSRFPFSLSLSRSDTRTENFSDVALASGTADFTVTRMTLRQEYTSRSNVSTNVYYTTSDVEGAGVTSNSKGYGLASRKSWSSNSLALDASHSTSSSSESDREPEATVITLHHGYIPGGEVGVTNLVSRIETDSGDPAAESATQFTQFSSNFYWRPEHRAMNVNGGARVSEARNEGIFGTSVTKSMDTRIGMGYRLTRRTSLTGSLSLGTSDSGTEQSMHTSQSLSVAYSSEQIMLATWAYQYQGSVSASNTTTRSDNVVLTKERVSDSQSYNGSIGHSVNNNWDIGQTSSLSFSLSQSASEGGSSEANEPSRSLNHGMGLGWSLRGKRSGMYSNLNMSDSRNFGETESNFQQLSASISQDMTINRLSNMNSNIAYQASRGETETVGKVAKGTTESMSGSVNYNHNRPFGIFNLTFSSALAFSRNFEDDSPGPRVDWDNRFRYALGLLSSSLGIRVTRSPTGQEVRSLNFSATRSF